jgi:site-specific DNA recombinase
MVMTFAEFEREVISERTRDKIAASRRRGLWTGGRPPLGYDVIEKKLIINEEEAANVRKIFLLFLKFGSLVAVVNELMRKAWNQKSWTTKNGKFVKGSSFDKHSLRRLLSNPVYIGKMGYKGEVYEGLHDAIIDHNIWDMVQKQLHHKPSRKTPRTRWNSLLSGILRCGICKSSYTHTYSSKNNRKYRYYVCQSQEKRGAAACPGSRVPAADIERFIFEKIRSIGKNPKIVMKAISAADKELKDQKTKLSVKLKRYEKDKRKLNDERRNIVNAIAQSKNGSESLLQRLDEIEREYGTLASKAQATRKSLDTMESMRICENDLKSAFSSFLPIWEQLSTKEQSRILHLLIEEILFDSKTGDVEITFRPEGVKAIAGEDWEKA